MKINATLIAGLIFVILAVAFFALVTAQQSFPVFTPSGSSQSSHFVNSADPLTVGREDSSFMWNSYNLALIAQAVALFAAAAATLALLRIDEEKKPE